MLVSPSTLPMQLSSTLSVKGTTIACLTSMFTVACSPAWGPVHSKDKYKLSPVSMSLTSKLKPICKFRRSTVQRLRHLATTVPRESALAGTAPAALKGNYTGKFLVERRKGWLKPRAALCLLAAEVAASVPSPVKVPGAPDRSSMLWWVAAAACVVCLGRV